MSSVAPCIWFDGNAEEAASFYASIFPDSRVDAVRRAPADFHSGKAGDVIVVEFTVLGLPFVGRNGGEEYRLGDGLAFLIRTVSQEETDRYWNAIVGNGGQEGERGRCKDRFGLWWQIVPRRLGELLADADGDRASRIFAAMMSMRKFDIAALERAADAGGTEPGVRAGPS
jgi:predicted 3-demethylubiquinone-9 3-methyltransferase (glyoxalase superfamily)